MQEQQTSGLDLPMKALAWDVAYRKTMLTYSDRHGFLSGMGLASAQAVSAMVGMMDVVIREVVG